MALDAVVRGVGAGVGADVNAAGELKVATSQNPSTAGWTRLAGAAGQPVLVAEDGHVLVGQDQMTFYDQIDGAAVNVNLWAQTNGTQTTAQAAGLLALNASLLTTVSTYAMVASVKQVPLYGVLPVIMHIGAIVNTTPQANATIELGLGTAAALTAPTDGVFFRWNSVGDFVGVMNYAGAETTVVLPTPSINESHNYEIVVNNADVIFMVDGALLATLAKPAAQPFPVSNARLPVFARTVNAASAPSTAPRLQIGNVMVLQGILEQNRDWATTLAVLGRGAYQSPVTAFIQTANFANSAAPASASLVNTAAGYANLGGRWQFVAIAGSEVDYPLFSFQVPTGFQLIVTGLVITSMNTVVAVATTPTVLEWGLGLNASATTLVTADGTGTWGARRLPVGSQSFPVAAAVGATATDIVRTFDPPLVVDSGRFFQVLLRMPVATATATEIFRGMVGVTGYFE